MESSCDDILNELPAIIWTAGSDGIIAFTNRYWSIYTGMPPVTAENSGWHVSVRPDDISPLLEQWELIRTSGEAAEMEARLRRADGQYRWFLFKCNPAHGNSGRNACWNGIALDVHDLRCKQTSPEVRDVAVRSVVDELHVPIVVTDQSNEIKILNHMATGYFGRTVDDLTTWATPDTIHPDDLDRSIKRLAEAYRGATPYDLETRYLRADGSYRWHNARGFPLRAPQGDARWLHLLIDLEDRKQAEEELRAKMRSLSEIIDTIPVLAWSARPDGSAEFFNQHFLDYLGLDEDRAKGWGWASAIHPDDINGLTAYWQSNLASGQPGEAKARLRRFDGTFRWLLFRTSPLRDESGSIIRWYGTNTDIEDQKRVEDELRISEQSLTDAQRLSRTGSFSWRSGQRHMTLSAEACRILEIDSNAPVNISEIRKRIHPENLPAIRKIFSRTRRVEGGVDCETRLLLPGETVKHLRVLMRSERSEAGELELRGAIQDVTEVRIADEALARARSDLAHVSRVTSFGALSASIAHEVSQPLSGILMNASTCLRMLDGDPPNIKGARETVRRTIRDGSRAADIITRLRALYSKKPVVANPLDLNEIAKDVIALLWVDLQRNLVTVRSEFSASIPPVQGDRLQLEQVIMNLLRNAADSMISVENRPRQLVIRTELDGSDYVRLSVQDTGTGFEADHLDRLFEAFYTTKRDGLGIGLSLSRSIIESHAGRLWASLNNGPGATFSFSIPVYHLDAESTFAVKLSSHSPDGIPSSQGDHHAN